MEKPYVTVEMPDGSVWGVPAKVIAEDRAKYYAEKDKDTTFEAEFEYTLGDDYELKDWLANNMNWADIKAHAVKLELDVTEFDYDEGLCNGYKTVAR